MTWGISGKQFLLIYALALLAVLIGNAWLRRRPLRSHHSRVVVAPASLTVDEIAYLSGGAYALGLSALVGLSESGGAFSPTPHWVVADSRGIRGASTPAQRALYDALVRRKGSPVNDVGRLLHGTTAVHLLRASLADRGLTPNSQLRARNRLGALAFALLLGIGVIRVVIGIRDDRPVAYLLLLMIATVFIAIRTLRVRPVTSAGRAALRQHRIEERPLRRASLPGDRARAVALFGVEALWLAEPDMADELGFPSPATAAFS